MSTRYVSFAGNAVAIDYADDGHHELLHFLFGDLDNRETAMPLSRFRFDPCGDDGGTRLEQDGERVFAGGDRAGLARLLLEKTLESLVEHARDGLAIHAAAVTSGPFGILIPGKSGAGKSTLASWLVHRGYGYLSDELVHIPLDASRIEGFPRPINLKRGGRRLLESELALDISGAVALSTAELSIVPHRLFNSSYEGTTPAIGAILFPHRVSSNVPQRLEPLSRGRAALKLVECLVNGRNIADHGIHQLTRIARQAPAYVLYYSGFESLPGLLARVVPKPAGFGSDTSPHVRDAVV